ncbi:MAG: glycosyltransferase family 39 protein [Gemmataceae bacterium]|nr:glycosyltransferase family 39 protein [Gemmataceae bacterium]
MRFQGRLTHYLILIVVHLLLTLPRLDALPLTDVDEGINSEAAREMLEAENYVTPHYNYQLRTAKPALLYWVQSSSYRLFGVSDWSARFPAVLFGLFTVLMTYELARQVFSPATGLLSGLILLTSIEFALLSHAATPDPPLLFFTTSALVLFWLGSRQGQRWWFCFSAFFCGLAVLTKGPVGLALPGLIGLLTFAVNGNLKAFWDRRLLWALLVFLLVALPWYGLVAADTRGVWPRRFFLEENLERFNQPKENHKGPIFYHLGLLFVLFTPWSVFLIVVFRVAYSSFRSGEDANQSFRADHRFLIMWFLTYLIFFSIAATKLPNYILPLYPALAILTGRSLERWRTGPAPWGNWVIPAALGGYLLTGVLVIVGLLLAGGAIPLPKLGRPFEGFASVAWVGLFPIGAGIGFYWFARKQQNTQAIASLVLGAILFTGSLGIVAVPQLEKSMAPRGLVQAAGRNFTDRECRVLALGWLHPSAVFYVQREIARYENLDEAVKYFTLPQETYLFIPAPFLPEFQSKAPQTKELARRYDFYTRREIVLVWNGVSAPD